MPTVISHSNIRVAVEQLSLSLGIRHRLLVGSEDTPVLVTEKRLPKKIEAALSPEFYLSFKGRVRNAPVTADTFKSSAVWNRFLTYMRDNAEQLGIDDINEAQLDGKANVKRNVMAIFFKQAWFKRLVAF